MPRFKKGQPRPAAAGRRPGSPNKVTKEVRTAILEALNADAGATAFFRRLKNGSAEDRRTFAMVCARLIPRPVELDLPPESYSTVQFYLPASPRGPMPNESMEDFRKRIAEKT